MSHLRNIFMTCPSYLSMFQWKPQLHAFPGCQAFPLQNNSSTPLLPFPGQHALPAIFTPCPWPLNSLLVNFFYYSPFSFSPPTLPTTMYSSDILQILSIFQKLKKKNKLSDQLQNKYIFCSFGWVINDV